MKRPWLTFVLSLAILSLLAPAAALCVPFQQMHQGDHACCGADAQLASPSCCNDAAPNALVPQSANNGAMSEFAILLWSAGPLACGYQKTAQYPVAAYPPILLPATVLRT